MYIFYHKQNTTLKRNVQRMRTVQNWEMQLADF